jgi:hypothetical protein
MPRRVPRRERSGQIFGKQEPGSVTRLAEKKPGGVHVSVSQPRRGDRGGRGWRTPKHTESDEVRLVVNPNPTEPQHSTCDCAPDPRHHVPAALCYVSPQQSAEERTCQTRDKDIQRR